MNWGGGGTLGLALDLDAGTLQVSHDGGEWAPAFPSSLEEHAGPIAPSAAAGAALFPAVCGDGGARVRFNWGADAGRPLKHDPPSGEYHAVGLACDSDMMARTVPPALPFPPSPPTNSPPIASDAVAARHWPRRVCVGDAFALVAYLT